MCTRAILRDLREGAMFDLVHLLVMLPASLGALRSPLQFHHDPGTRLVHDSGSKPSVFALVAAL